MSIYLLAAFFAWILAQGSKVALVVMTDRSQWRAAVSRSGGMPSAHSALMVSQLTAIGISDGIRGPMFALAAVITLIIMYDAVNVRRAVGEQGTVLSRLISVMKMSSDEYSYKHAAGHLLPEVLVGAVIGVASAYLALLVV